MRTWVQAILVPLIRRISKDLSLILHAELHFLLCFLLRGCFLCILSLNVKDNIAVLGIEAYFIRCESNFLTNFPSHLLEVDFVLVHTYFSK